jgi:hypothetical protein
VSVAVLVLLVLGATVSALFSSPAILPHTSFAGPLSLATAFGLALSALASVESLGQAALDLEQPRIRNLQRVARLVSGYGIRVGFSDSAEGSGKGLIVGGEAAGLAETRVTLCRGQPPCLT